MKLTLSRREFLRRAGLGVAAGAAAAVGAGGAQAANPTPPVPPNYPIYLPLVQQALPSVVRIHAADATAWDFKTGWYGEAIYVNQTRVDSLLTRGLKELTGKSTPGDAWALLMPGYAPGKKIAIKVNLNNSQKDDTDTRIDALPQVVIALLKTLVTDYNVAEPDVMIYDALRPMPARFYNPVHAAFPQAGCFDNGTGYAPVKATFGSDPSLKVVFTHPNLKGERYLTDLLFQATYVINMPIMKKHGAHPVTLGFKNHFGSLSTLQTITDDNDNPHPYISPGHPFYTPATVPFVDINANPNIRNKTVLTIGDGLFGSSQVNASPERWIKTFESKSPNSLLFSRDPVAIDSVMADLLRAEFGLDGFPVDSAYDYLANAEQRGLGRFEKGEPWGAGYSKIKYKVVEM